MSRESVAWVTSKPNADQTPPQFFLAVHGLALDQLGEWPTASASS